jgi:hypothetical protein
MGLDYPILNEFPHQFFINAKKFRRFLEAINWWLFLLHHAVGLSSGYKCGQINRLKVSLLKHALDFTVRSKTLDRLNTYSDK